MFTSFDDTIQQVVPEAGVPDDTVMASAVLPVMSKVAPVPPLSIRKKPVQSSVTKVPGGGVLEHVEHWAVHKNAKLSAWTDDALDKFLLGKIRQ